jgi:cysteine desulfurase/selenocysteine lyase
MTTGTDGIGVAAGPCATGGLRRRAGLDLERIRTDVAILGTKRNGHRLVYLDSASSSQRPEAVLAAMDDYYRTTHANVHRGVYALAEESTARFEAARRSAGRLINAPSPATEIIFTRNVTESMNLLAHSWGRRFLSEGDAVLLSETEHHANLVPWLMLAEERGIVLRFLSMRDDYRLDLSGLGQLVDGVKLVSVTAMSNVTGAITDLEPIVAAAHAAGALVAVDAAQLVPHRRVDVTALDVDFLGFTSHKMLGPTGIGVLYGRETLLEQMPPFLGGGEMISDVRLDGFSPTELPWKFEAGTPAIAEAVGLGAAIDYLDGVGIEAISQHETALTDYALTRLQERLGEDLVVFGPGPGATDRGGVVSFAFAGIHPHDLAQVLDEAGVCVRAGHHCAKPLMRRLGVSATTRASFYCYSGEDDVDALIDALEGARRLFHGTAPTGGTAALELGAVSAGSSTGGPRR